MSTRENIRLIARSPLGKFDLFHLLLSMNGKLWTQNCPGVDMQE